MAKREDATKEVLHYATEVEKNPSSKVTQQAYFSAEEMYRNAYEDACAKYLDKKLMSSVLRKCISRKFTSW